MTQTTAQSISVIPREAELIQKAAAGNAKAFRLLVNQYLPIVYSYLYRMTQNHELSEEMAQEAFVKAYQNLKTFDSNRAFKPWILRIASNAMLSELRKQKNSVSLNAMEEDGQFGEVEARISASKEAESYALSSEELQQALNKLDAKYRQVLLLRYQQDLSYEEIADTMQTPLNTVRTWLKRGVEKLRLVVQEATS